MVATGGAFSADTYVCVMKAKQGEIFALDGVPASQFVPLFEVPIAGRAADICKHWAPGEAIWLQPLNIEGVADPDFADETREIFSRTATAGIAAIPVITLEEAPDSVTAFQDVMASQGVDLVLRLEAEDLVMASPAVVKADIDAFLASYGVAVTGCDLVIDAALVRDSVPARVATVNAAIAVIPYLADWRNVVVALSAFPDDMGAHAPKNSVHGFSRDDRAAFMAIQARGPARQLNYADFGVGLPTYADIAFSPIPNIKYTDVAEWQVHRANSKTNPSPQYVALAKDVAAAPYFRGATFSTGDTYVYNVANGADGPGNAATYLRAAMSHHIHHVLDRLASHGEP